MKSSRGHQSSAQPQDFSKPQDRSMPDSAYDIDTNRGYYAIWCNTVQFHSMLKSGAETYRESDPVLDLKHFDKALRDTVVFFSRKYHNRRGIIISITAEVVLVVGGICITPLLSSVIEWIRNPQTSTAPDSVSILLAVLGIVLIVGKVVLKIYQVID
jgi:hypothetical protein